MPSRFFMARSKKLKELFLIALFIFLTHTAYAKTPIDRAHPQNRAQILLTTDKLSRTTDELFSEGKIPIDLDGNGIAESTINYSYNKIGPPDFENGKEIISEPIITMDIDTPKENLKISYLCSAIGIYHEKNNGYRDIFCGPNLRLKWTGSEYSE